MARTELPNGVILPAEYSDDWYEDMTSNLTKLDDVIGSDSEKLNADGVSFLRMSSAALTDGGTGNFSDLNSSYKIKTGDLVLDSGRKLYQVVSVDSTNERFTVGNSLFKITAESDLAPVAESGDYDDLDNKPDLKPVATSGDYDDLTDLPTYGITRYCSSAITDNSSVAFSAISSTDKIKVGDFLLDINGKIYQISSVDTSSETVSVTVPLTQLAVDSGVMHLSGAETAAGPKTFSEYITSDGSAVGDEFSGNARTNLWLMGNRDDEDVSGILIDTFRQNAAQGTATHIIGFGIKENSVRYEGCRYSWIWDTNLNGYSFSIRPTLQGTNQAVEHNLGLSTDKWDKINGISPGALSLPDLNNGIDISGYITVTGGNKESLYTPPSNGWISVRLARTSGALGVLLIQGNMASSGKNIEVESGTTTADAVLPVTGGVQVSINSALADSIVSAYFYPCQGNV